MAEREELLLWQLATSLVDNCRYELIQLDEEHGEVWLKNKKPSKKNHVIRLSSGGLDWSSQMARSIEETGYRAERLRRSVRLRNLQVLNVYLSLYPPVDDYEHLLREPFLSKGGKTKIDSILVTEENELKAIEQMNHFLDCRIDPFTFGDIENAGQVKRLLIERIKKEEEEARSLFEQGKPFFTYIFIAVQVLMFAVLEFAGGSTNTEVLVKYGAKYNPGILSGEWWRLVTPVFLHIGILHLLMNTLALYYLGTAVEKMYGRFRFLWIYLFSGVAGTAASFLFNTNLSAGASGAIFGCFGALLYVGVSHPRLFFRTMGANVIVLIVINLVFGFTVPGIDNAGHLGGLAGGFLAAGAVRLPGKGRVISQTAFLLAAAGLLYGAVMAGLHNDRPETVNALAQVQIEEGNVEEAYESLKKYVESGKGNAVTYFQLSYAEIQMGFLDDAKGNLKKVIELQPDFHEAYFNLAVIYAEEGKEEKAREYIKKAEGLSDQQKYKDFLDRLDR